MEALVRQQFVEHLGADLVRQADIALVCTLADFVTRTSGGAGDSWGLEFGDAPERVGVRVRAPRGTVLSDAHVDALFKLSPRVLGVRIMLQRHRYVVYARLDAATANTCAVTAYTPPAVRRERCADVNWHNGGITARDDVQLCDAVIDTVYNYADVMPRDVRFWYENIDRHGIMRTKTGTSPLEDESFDDATTTDDNDDSTEGAHHDGGGAAVAAVGMALCFDGMPEIDGDFLRHVRRAHGARVTAAYVWFSARPLLVVNAHRSHVVADAEVQRACAADAKRSRPRDGISVPRAAAKRVAR